MRTPPRVGIFEAEWPLNVHVVNSALVLAESGFDVDLFLYRVDETFSAGELDDVSRVRIIRFCDGETHGATRSSPSTAKLSASRREGILDVVSRTRPARLLRDIGVVAYRSATRRLISCYPTWLDRRRGEMPDRLIRDTLRAMSGNRYRVLLGIEKRGLIWAGQVARHTGVPHIYHSLELFTRDYYGSRMTVRKQCIAAAEARYHRSSYATIVQDPARGKVLFDENRLSPSRVLYVPVSLLDSGYGGRASFLQEKLRLGRDVIVILQFGWMSNRRLCVELAQVAQRLPGSWTLVMHGFGPEEYLAKIRAADAGHRVKFSLELVPAAQLPELVSSAHVGLAVYRPLKDDDRLSVLSSEKIALFLQQGVPIVALDNPGLDILEQKRCGAVVRELDEIPSAIERVLTSWEEYSRNARALFEERYEFRTNYAKVVQTIRDLP